MTVLSDIVPVFSLSPATPIGLWWLSSLVLAVGFLVLLAVMPFDPRRLDRETVWAKPAKFALSLAIHFATLAIIAGWLSPIVQTSPVLTITAWSSIVATIGEMAYITLQAARGQRSHFNRSTPIHATFYALMALGAVVITAAAGVVGLQLMNDPAVLPSPAARLGAIIGLLGGTTLTLVTAFRMGAVLSHHSGTESAGAARMPLTGWSLTIGDRRVPHFFATHMMQILPVFGVVAGMTLPDTPALALTALAAIAYTGATLFTFAQANQGRPVLRAPRERMQHG